MKWYRKAAQQGYARAQSNLGWMYRNGKGVTQDKIAAHMWYNIAAANRFLGAVDSRDKVAKPLTVEQLVKTNEQEKRCISDPNVTHNGKVIAYRNCDTKAKQWWQTLSEVELEFDNFLLIIASVIVFYLLVLIVVIVVLIKKRDTVSWRMGSPGGEPTWNWDESIPFSKSRSRNADISLEENDTVSSSSKDDVPLGSLKKETNFPEHDIDAGMLPPFEKDRADPFRNHIVQRAETSKLKPMIKVDLGVFIATVTGLYLVYKFGFISRLIRT